MAKWRILVLIVGLLCLQTQEGRSEATTNSSVVDEVPNPSQKAAQQSENSNTTKSDEPAVTTKLEVAQPTSVTEITEKPKLAVTQKPKPPVAEIKEKPKLPVTQKPKPPVTEKPKVLKPVTIASKPQEVREVSKLADNITTSLPPTPRPNVEISLSKPEGRSFGSPQNMEPDRQDPGRLAEPVKINGTTVSTSRPHRHRSSKRHRGHSGRHHRRRHYYDDDDWKVKKDPCVFRKMAKKFFGVRVAMDCI